MCHARQRCVTRMRSRSGALARARSTSTRARMYITHKRARALRALARYERSRVTRARADFLSPSLPCRRPRVEMDTQTDENDYTSQVERLNMQARQPLPCVIIRRHAAVNVHAAADAVPERMFRHPSFP